MREVLTRRQAELLRLIAEHRRSRGYSPTLREISDELGLSSVATVAEHLDALERKGFIRRLPGRARSVTLTRKGGSLVAGAPAPVEASGVSGAPPARTAIPLLGVISAGQPIEAVPVPEELEVPASMVRGKECYALKVRGYSMMDEGILDGDYVIVERKSTAENGETVVALINGDEVTLKNIYREGDGLSGRIRLQPANPGIEPITLEGGTGIEIQGKVIGILRLMERGLE